VGGKEKEEMKKLIKWVLILMAIGAVALFVIGFVSTAPMFQKSSSVGGEPQDATYIVQTNTRAYYTMTQPVETTDRILMEGFYAVEKGKWVYHPENLVLIKKAFASIKVIRRN
jgi:hypothetical protein